MPHIDIEIDRLKAKLMEMWDLVEFQLQSGRQMMVKSDPELNAKVQKLGKKVNQYDIKIDRLCENVFALFTPVAVDLRTVLAILKINANLERIGDTAEGISFYTARLNQPVDPELAELTKLLLMYDEALSMFAECRKAFINNDTELAKQVIKRDKVLNKIYRKSDACMVKYLTDNPDKIAEGLIVTSFIKKLERVGDQITNIAEEVIFYRDAKVVKHKSKKKKKDE